MDRRSILLDIYRKMESDYDGFLDGLREYVERKLRNVTTHQLRRIYVLTKNARNVNDIKALRFQLAYIAGRISRRDFNNFYYDMDILIRRLQADQVEKFKKFMEALIAYHKFYAKEKE